MYEASVLNYPVNVNLLSKWLGTITSTIMSSNIIKNRVSLLKYILESPAKDLISSLIHEVRSRASARSLAKKQSQSPMPSQEPSLVSRVFPVFIRLSSVRRQRSFYQFSLQHFSSLFLDYSKQDQRKSSSVFCVRLITIYSRKRMSPQFYREIQVHKAKSKAAESKIFLSSCDYSNGDYARNKRRSCFLKM